MNAGFLITLEGGEGVGKSTQVRRLVARLEAAGRRALATREPGGSAKAEAIRGLLLSGAVAPFGPAAEALLFAAARVDHLDRLIRPALAQGTIVVSDRFIDSTRVYQGIDRRVEPRFLVALETVTVGATRPDLTIILDLPSAVGLARAAARRAPSAIPDRFEREALAFHDGLRRGFLTIAAAEPDRCAVVDAEASADEAAERIWRVVETRLLTPRSSAP
ncbi:dTMP kinase [Lichenifustis flavocetrariae]|uniref:Thymidylate kinase n=1 Tax=Lichenifustis flavocetrariae TaxID=2949735 RepID=A0AA41YS91_9HYPH|nr:dTMP kinase [Lichenifustis flavocetrariae]MCW6507611.1 dTMP kinase [Lichenifustis flavocetrariae]